MTARLECCRPTAYSAGSQILVHSLLCENSDKRLTKDEEREFFRRLRAERDHPSVRVRPITPLVENWWREHDAANPTGCGNSDCFRCGGADDEGPYDQEREVM